MHTERRTCVTHELISQEQDGLEREFAVAEVEQILETGSEQVEDHGVVITLYAEPSHERHADAACQSLVNLGLVFELRVLGLD